MGSSLLHPPTDRRERICVYGQSNCGKTSCAVAIANWIARTGAESQMYFVDTDGTAEASIPDEYIGRQVHVFDVDGRDDVKKAMTIIRGKLERDRHDWLTVDMSDKLWTYAQNAFFELGYGIDPDDFFIDAKKKALARSQETGKGEAIGDYVAGDHGINWQIINKMYGEMAALLKSRSAHVLCCAPATEVRRPDRSGKGGDDPEIIGTFSRVGVKPAGQKDFPHLFHTILLLQGKAGSGGESVRIVNTQKERVPLGFPGRERLVATEMTVDKDFVRTYLMGVAKWMP